MHLSHAETYTHASPILSHMLTPTYAHILTHKHANTQMHTTCLTLTCAHAPLHTHTNIYTQETLSPTCSHKHKCTPETASQKDIHTCTAPYSHTHIHICNPSTFAHTHMHKPPRTLDDTHTCIHVHTHTHTHTHMHVQTLCSHIHMHLTYMLKHNQDHMQSPHTCKNTSPQSYTFLHAPLHLTINIQEKEANLFILHRT